MSDSFLSDLSLPSVGAILPAILTGLGTGMEYSGNQDLASNARLAGARQAAALQFQAQQATVNAGQAVAASQQTSADIARQGALIQSRAQALAAASGGGAVDPTVVTLMSRNAGEIALRRNIALYQGEEQARTLMETAKARNYDASLAVDGGNTKAQAYENAATTSLLKGAGSMFAKYGFGQPKASDPGSSKGTWTSGYDVPSMDSQDYFSY